MKWDGNSPELEFACHAVRVAAALSQQIQAELGFLELTKDDQSPVTVADFAGQAVIAHLLEKAFPQDVLVGEESVQALCEEKDQKVLRKVTEYVSRVLEHADSKTVCDWIERGSGKPGKRFWTVDPIDGTKGFLRGDQYAVALALIEGGHVRLGVLGCPHLNARGEAVAAGEGGLFAAVRGQGAWSMALKTGQDWTRLRVSNLAAPDDLRILRSVEPSHAKIGLTQAFRKNHGIRPDPRPMDSQAKYAVLAAGHAEVFFYLLPSGRPEYRMKIWDVAPGAILVEEAGGRTSDLEGKPLDFGAGASMARNPGLLISNGAAHDFVLDALRTLDSAKG